MLAKRHWPHPLACLAVLNVQIWANIPKTLRATGSGPGVPEGPTRRSMARWVCRRSMARAIKGVLLAAKPYSSKTQEIGSTKIIIYSTHFFFMTSPDNHDSLCCRSRTPLFTIAPFSQFILLAGTFQLHRNCQMLQSALSFEGLAENTTHWNQPFIAAKLYNNVAS